MSDVVEGRNAVLELLRAAAGVSEILVAEGLKPDERLDEIGELASASGIALRAVSRARLDEMSSRGAHQGVVARVADFVYVDIEDVVRDEGDSLLVVLDHVTDPQNLGAIARSAEALGADGLIIPKARSARVSGAALKAAAGALAHLPVALVPNIARSVEHLKHEAYWVIGASEDGEQVAWEAPLHGRVALVLGAEGAGLSRLVSESCDLLVRIPLSGRTPSLNVAQAATVLAYEWTRGASSE